MAGGKIDTEDLVDDLEATKMIVRLVRPELNECEVAAAAEVMEASRMELPPQEWVALDRVEKLRRRDATRAAIEEAIAGCRKTNEAGIGIE
jgi:hypothetical protein